MTSRRLPYPRFDMYFARAPAFMAAISHPSPPLTRRSVSRSPTAVAVIA